MTDAVRAAAASDQVRLPIVCFSHLGWDENLYQRPQQILSRLAARGYPVYYFACVGHYQHRAQPMAGAIAGAPGVNVYTLPYAPGVKRLTGIRRWMASLKVASILARNRVHKPILWFYNPLLFPLGYSHPDSAIVYDVMDHFPSFEKSNDDLYYEELTLLAETDVVFTGGRSLDRHIRSMVHELYSDINSDDSKPTARDSSLCEVHCLPSGVDLPHFYSALQIDADVTTEIGKIKEPRFGYFGAIDERLDWDLIRQLATNTHGSVVLAGPQLQSPPEDLPANVHLLGGVPYNDLPGLLAGFTVCLIPFKDSPLVSYVSPTKTPEYLAGGKPVVSTPIPDVITDYADVVRVAPAGPEYVTACLELAENPPDPNQLAAQAAERAKTWDDIATEMDSVLTRKIGGGRSHPSASS